MNKSFYILFLFITNSVYGQSDQKYWDNWNKNYPEVDIVSILKQEKLYADSIEKNPAIPRYYSRLDNYRFKAVYLGKTRATSQEVITSMKNVYKLFTGNASRLDGMIESEVLFKIGQEETWMPVQPQILEALKKEVKKGNMLTVYCLHFNEHNSKNILYNTFLISEFYK
ncbi:MAG: hypothetical protein B7X86_16230 [Sphingobacteriales bacterium 17-39-43]|uniref:hypothetical protein n=1 Tax=Daejeonella sp. TaxID=2805397 RepID=UPI000BCF688D|nr:hypothetical protein [Daejeonella sp.]OYZ28899.1 MAG: hypothetical protein B7Y24_16060 [Sphingobacteriales bacterium 16-39-50]OZA22242.1 MAG: hypothetical protein B7X86_16230 [Sphingobacteriales bacterium 17-39-43]HQT22507.1 hypothetical protein [Daejeonella sp.]HQT59243.1 hypothetical protein [Daejeonella sp.]